ncbi:putative ubiquitin-like-specific protease 2A [Dorcoceras hygrometricum]|nr:putative ubiquitin-like-specific protease 2A [Dorcoceras hygrometricum]
MLLLDSLHAMNPKPLKPLIRMFMFSFTIKMFHRLVADIFRTEGRHENIGLINDIVPQQRNGVECGVFVLYYTHLFVENRQNGLDHFQVD